MKLRTTVLACLIALAASPAFAQGSRGVKVGLNLSNVTFEPAFTYDTQPGFLAGFYFRAAGNDVISLQPEVLFSIQGAKNDDFEVKLKLNYIQIPVLAHVNVGTAAVQPFVSVGPTFGVRIKAEREDPQGTEDFNDDIKLIDVGLAVGAGVQMKRGVSIEARYTWGLTNIAVTDGPHIVGTTSLKNKVLSISLGFGF